MMFGTGNAAMAAAGDYPEQTVKKTIVAPGTKYATELYVIKSSVPGPVVMVVGGVHGNEPAGYKAAEQLVDTRIKKGTLLVLPKANKRAVEAGVRYISGGYDLNRAFPRYSSDKADTLLAREIFAKVKSYKVDWLMDMHEGYDYSTSKATDSVGQTLIYYPAAKTLSVATAIINKLNQQIYGSYKDFSLLRYPTSGSLASASGKLLGVNSFIFETCSKEALSSRIKYQKRAAYELLDRLNMR